MCDTSNITVGTIVMVKVGRNEIEVVVTEITANGWKVKKVGSDREFIVTRIERVIATGSGRGSGHAQSRAGIRRIAGEEALTPECGSAGPQAQPDAAQHERDPRASHRRRSLEPEWSKDSGAEPLLRILPRDQGEGDAARPQECRPLDVCAKMLLFYFLSAPEVIPNQTGARSAGFLRKFSKGCCRNGRSRQLLGMRFSA